MDKSFWQATIRFIIVTLAIISLFIISYYILPLIYPFLIGIGFALIFNPIVRFLEKKARFPRWLSATLAILSLLALLVTLVVLVVIEIGRAHV